MRKLAPILTLAALLSVTFAMAQREVVVIDRGGRSSEGRQPKLNENVNVFKFSPLQMIMGELNFGYERQISKKGSLEFELGPTISRIGLGTQSHLFGTNNHTSKFGFHFGLGYRYYPLEKTEALNRLYISPVVKFRLYNYGVTDVSGSLPAENGTDVQLNFTFNVGYQLWAAKTFALDFFMGTGLGMRKITDYNVSNVWNNGQWEEQWNREVSSFPRYVFTAGFKIGIGKE